MSRDDSAREEWSACQKGEIQQLARRLRWRRRDRNLARAVSVAGALLAVVFVGSQAVWHFQQPRDDSPRYAGISCRDVEAHGPEFLAGQLAPETADRIRRHLEQCPECGARFRRMQEAAGRPVAAAWQPQAGNSRARRLGQQAMETELAMIHSSR